MGRMAVQAGFPYPDGNMRIGSLLNAGLYIVVTVITKPGSALLKKGKSIGIMPRMADQAILTEWRMNGFRSQHGFLLFMTGSAKFRTFTF